MGRPLRDKNPQAYHMVTTRTLEAFIWMVPSRELNVLIGGILARYQEIYKITLYAYCILGNHLHLLIGQTDGQLDLFMENVLREIAARVNRLNKRHGTFWARPYDDQVILSEHDLLEAFLYVVTNPVRHGLTRHARSWPGLGCYHQVLDEAPRQYSFTHYSIKDERGIPRETKHELVLSPLPQFSGLDERERKELVKALLGLREDDIAAKRCANQEGFLGAVMIRKQPVGRKPITVSRSRRPVCYSKDPQIKRQYRRERREFRQRYRDASASFRSGDFGAAFPPHCFKPPLHRMPSRPSVSPQSSAAQNSAASAAL